MELIERYIYAVTEYLPEDIREDVGKELLANIEDMLPENFTDDDVYRVLEELGSPWKLADDYNTKKRYLIGPAYYNKYVAVLKIVIGICIAAFTCIAMLSIVIEAPKTGYLDGNMSKLIANILATAFDGAWQGALWVTLVFVVLERTGAGTERYKSWTPKKLPIVPVNNKYKIPRGKTIVSMFFTILFIALLYMNPQLMAIYSKDVSGIVTAAPLFNIVRLQSYFIIFLILFVSQLGLFTWKYIAGSWNKPLAIGNAVYQILLCVFILLLISDQALFNQDFFAIMKRMTYSSDELTVFADQSKLIFAGIIIIICALDSILGFVRSQGNKQISIK